MTEIEVPEAQVGEIELNLSWESVSGRLEGTLEAVNVSDHPVRLTGKPGLKPLGTDGNPLDTTVLVTLEMRLPGYVVLQPGAKASTPVGWAGWNGPAASGTVVVSWDTHQTEVQASGPSQPPSEGPTTNLWTSWFTLL